jgi:hypothetical protein
MISELMSVRMINILIRLFLFNVCFSSVRSYVCLVLHQSCCGSIAGKKSRLRLISQGGNGHMVNRSLGFCIQLLQGFCFLRRFGDETSCIVRSLRIRN